VKSSANVSSPVARQNRIQFQVRRQFRPWAASRSLYRDEPAPFFPVHLELSSDFHVVPDAGTISSRRECDGFLVAFASGHHVRCHSRHLIGKHDRGNLHWPPRHRGRASRDGQRLIWEHGWEKIGFRTKVRTTQRAVHGELLQILPSPEDWQEGPQQLNGYYAHAGTRLSEGRLMV
jgi:hypothetical protein